MRVRVLIALIAVQALRSDMMVFMAGLSWVFAFGFDGMKSAPQCGDLMVRLPPAVGV